MNCMQKMNVIAKVSCYLERSVVTLKLRKEYLNIVAYNTSVLLWIIQWIVWCIERYSMSTYTGVTSPVFGPPCTCRFYSDSVFSVYRLFSSAILRAHRTELNKNRPCVRKWVWFENASTAPRNQGPKAIYFRRFSTTSQFNVTLTA